MIIDWPDPPNGDDIRPEFVAEHPVSRPCQPLRHGSENTDAVSTARKFSGGVYKSRMHSAICGLQTPSHEENRSGYQSGVSNIPFAAVQNGKVLAIISRADSKPDRSSSRYMGERIAISALLPIALPRAGALSLRMLAGRKIEEHIETSMGCEFE